MNVSALYVRSSFASRAPVTHALRVDPTRTSVVRKAFEREAVRRFRALKRDIVEALSESEVETNAKRKFKFDRRGKKVAEFMDWIRSEGSRKVLDEAKALSATDLSSAEAQLALATDLLTRLQASLIAKGAK